MTRAITLTPQPTHRATDPDGTTLAAYPAVIPGIGPAVHLRITDIDGCTLPAGDVEGLIAALRVAVGQASPAMSNLPADSNRRGVTVDLAAAAIVPTDRAPTEPAWPATQHPSQANLPQFAVVEDPFRALNDRLVDERERDQRRLTEWTTARQQALNALDEDAAVDADLPALPALVEALIRRGDQAVLLGVARTRTGVARVEKLEAENADLRTDRAAARAEASDLHAVMVDAQSERDALRAELAAFGHGVEVETRRLRPEEVLATILYDIVDPGADWDDPQTGPEATLSQDPGKDGARPTPDGNGAPEGGEGP